MPRGRAISVVAEVGQRPTAIIPRRPGNIYALSVCLASPRRGVDLAVPRAGLYGKRWLSREKRLCGPQEKNHVLEVVAWRWVGFEALVAVLLALDLLLFHRHDRVPSLREAAGWTVFWCGLAVAFNGLVWWGLGHEAGTAFLTGYVIEWSLSMDNVFVFAVVFRFFQIPAQYQYRVLFWGILGAVVLRLAFVLAGTQLIHHFDWVLPLFGLLLIYTARPAGMAGRQRSASGKEPRAPCGAAAAARQPRQLRPTRPCLPGL